MRNENGGDRTERIRRVFQEYLRGRNVKCTDARRKVLEAVLDLREHFEAEQVLYFLRERSERVGKATVYRTLPLLVEAGILREVRFDVKHTHYELAFGEAPHDHMVCGRCGRIIEFGSNEVTKLRSKIARQHGFRVTGHRFQITGVCKDCAAAFPAAGQQR